MRILFISLIFLSSLFANVLQNNQTIVLTSNSTFAYAKDCFSKLQPFLKDRTAFILKSDSGYYMVTTGIYSNKHSVYNAIKQLPKKLQDKKPFRAHLKYDLNSNDARILFRQNNTIQQPDIPHSNLETMDKEIIQNITTPKTDKKQNISPKKVEKKDTVWIDSISFGYGQNWKNNDIYRLGLQKDFNTKFFESDMGYLSGYFDLGFSQVEYSQNVYVVSLNPIFAYYFNTQSEYMPYIYGGIGAAYISRTSVNEKSFSTAFQFEDQIGVGIKTKAFDINLGYIHYSNADIKEPNAGMDIGLLNILFHF